MSASFGRNLACLCLASLFMTTGDSARQVVARMNQCRARSERTKTSEAIQDRSAPNVWRGLIPLRSTRADVERLLGQAKDSVDRTLIYKTPAETVHVLYSEGPCTRNGSGQWRVPADTVIHIRVYPQKTTLLEDLHVDVSKYRRKPDPNIPNWTFYLSDKDGLIIQTKLENDREEVMIVTYGPTEEDAQLRCPAN